MNKYIMLTYCRGRFDLGTKLLPYNSSSSLKDLEYACLEFKREMNDRWIAQFPDYDASVVVTIAEGD